MAVLARDRFEELTLQLVQKTRHTGESQLPCGVILAPCANLNKKLVEQLKTFVSKNQTELSAHFIFDEQNHVLGMVLDERNLAATHYTSLIVKDFLQSHRLLEGQIAAASFPESGEPNERTLSEFVHLATNQRGEEKEIRLFVDQPVKEGVSSVLLVDTDEVVREFVKLHLELEGYEVYEAKDGYEAFEKYSQLSPDLVITELNLPILDGYQLISKIKKSSPNKGKVFVLSDMHSTDHLQRSFELGASEFVTKPFSISELQWRIKKLVGEQQK